MDKRKDMMAGMAPRQALIALFSLWSLGGGLKRGRSKNKN